MPYPAEFVGPGAGIVGPWKARLRARPSLRFSTGRGIPRLLQDGSRRSYLLSLPVVWAVRRARPRPLKLFDDEGWTEPEIEHVLTYLTLQKLDAFEQKVLGFARETVRYQTRRIAGACPEFCRWTEARGAARSYRVGLLCQRPRAHEHPAPPMLKSSRLNRHSPPVSVLLNAALAGVLLRMRKES